jgi:hypothetical protein
MKIQEGQTPKQAMLHQAAKYGLENEVEEEYHRALDQGLDERAAAWGALMEWDLLEYVSDDELQKHYTRV